MEPMKVNNNAQSLPNKDVEHHKELWLIRESAMKVHLIRCVSIRNLYQMKVMKVIFNMKSILKKKFEHDKEWKLSIRSQNIESISCSMNP
jgi:hypothetical protein